MLKKGDVVYWVSPDREIHEVVVGEYISIVGKPYILVGNGCMIAEENIYRNYSDCEASLKEEDKKLIERVRESISTPENLIRLFYEKCRINSYEDWAIISRVKEFYGIDLEEEYRDREDKITLEEFR